MTIDETTSKIQEQLKKMDLFLSVVNEGNKPVTPQVIKEFLVMILSVIGSTKNDFEKISNSNLEELKSAMQIIVEEYEIHLRKLEDKGNSSINEITKLVQETKKVFDEIIQQRIKLDKEANDLLDDIRTETAKDKEEVAKQLQDLKDLIPSPYTLEATKIRDELLSLKGDERLDISAIKGFEEWAAKISKGKGNNKNNIEYIQGGQGYVKSIIQGAGITVTTDANNNVTISASGGSGSGDVVGPSSSVDNTIPRFDSTTGKVLQSSGVVIDDSDNISAVGLTLSGLTASQLIATNGSKALVSLTTATYPSLTELAYVKGVTSAIQTQMDLKAPLASPTFTTSITGSYLTASEILITDGSKNIVSGAVATYPSLTELTYVKGVTSAIQTQINAKQATITFGTGVLTALGVNVGSAGAPVLFNGALGTPSSGTLTNCTGLPIAGLVASTSTAIGVGSIELGHATDTTITRVSAGVIAVEGVNVLLNGGALGTPSSGTLTNCTGLPIAGLTASTSTALGVGSIELGHASDTTIARVSAGVISVEGVTIPTISSTNTLSNKRITKRVYTATNNASLTPEIDTYDVFHLTAMSAATTINNHSTSTPTDGEIMTFRFLDNGTARGLTWGSAYVAKGGIALPTTTTLSKNLTVMFEYNSNLSKWNLLASALEA